ncbi:hypothetical protein LTR08_001780 [Meristemomyces frigidus]|nr:hypothetical protein LTR08_001780 [Meristemomyces frigidus]
MSEKGAIHDSHAGLPPPQNQAHFQTTSCNFVPNFEAKLNANLRNFGDPEAQYGQHDLDGTKQSGRDPKQRRKIKRNLMILAFVTLVSVCAIIIGLSVSRKEHQVSTAAPVQTDAVPKTIVQTALFQRSTQANGLVVITATVTALETVPVPSTQILTVTDSSTTTEITTMLATSTPSAATSYNTSSELAVARTTATASPQAPSFSPMSFSFKPSTTFATLPTSTTSANDKTTSTVNATAESSIQAALASLSSALIAEPVPTSSSTSTTEQATSTVLPSPASSPASSAPGPTATNGIQGGLFNFCSVPGSSCNQ